MCFTFASIQALDSLTRPGNSTGQAVMVTINTFDNCQGILLENASNFDPSTSLSDFTGTIQFGTNLSTATVVGTAPMFDANSGVLLFTTSIDVTWQGFGAATTFIDSSHSRSPGFIFNTHFTGDTRMAGASGTITDETGANLATPATPSWAMPRAARCRSSSPSWILGVGGGTDAPPIATPSQVSIATRR